AAAGSTPMSVPAQPDLIVAPNAEPTKPGGSTQLFNPKAAAAVLNANQAPVSSPGTFSKVFAVMPAAPASPPGGFTDLFSAGPQTQAPGLPAPAAGGFTQLFNASAPAVGPAESQPAASSFSQI